jgi:beta-mannosidase
MTKCDTSLRGRDDRSNPRFLYKNWIASLTLAMARIVFGNVSYNLIFFISVVVFTLQSPNVLSQVKAIYLHDNWSVKHHYGNEWIRATVPGTIHTDLLADNRIPDPFLEANEKLVQWVDTCTWDYQSKFSISDLNYTKAWLRFEGLDTYADVYVNGKLMLTTNNMFRQWNVDCSSVLKAGENELLIRFHPTAKIEKQKASTLSYTLPDNQRVFTRKAAYHYGWDWGPRIVTAGIWKPIVLNLQHGSLVVNDTYIQQISLNEVAAKLNVVSTVSGNLSDPVRVQVFNDVTNDLVGTSFATGMSQEGVVSTSIQINKPKLWWCNGVGEPNLYTLRVEVSSGLDKVITKKRIGLRTIELVQEPDSKGKSFYFKLNGRAVFMKGANIIPFDNFLPRVTANQYRTLVVQAKEANMNMLRVWGGGVYADDAFYDACDEQGILVWQDFMFANSMYPGDSSFYTNVKHEVEDQVVRLRNHPSLALWCGNNEISEGWFNWGWQKQFSLSKVDSSKIWQDYRILFEEIIPTTLAKHDVTRPYWPSSPKHGWGRKESLTEGDSHYWGVWWGLQPFEVYEQKVGRFMSEYGFQGMPAVSTFKKFTATELSLESDAVKHHQKHPTGYQTIEHYRKQWYRQPISFENYIFQSQLLQAEGMKIAIEAHRRNMPSCMGTLYWQLNDCWPVTSWSSIDYYGNEKAVYYFVKKAFSSAMVSIASDEKKYQVYFISDTLHAQKMSLELTLMDIDGNVKWNFVKSFQSVENNSQLLIEVDSVELARQMPLKNAILLAEIKDGKRKRVASTHFYFSKPKALELKSGDLLIKQHGKNAISLKSKTLLKNVHLEAGEGVSFSDNYVDVIPNQEVIIEVQSSIPLKEILKNLKMKSLVDTYEKP